MTKKLTILFIIFAVILIGGLSLSRFSGASLKISEAIGLHAPGLTFIAFGPNQVVYNGGQHFITYNYLSGSQTDLNPTTSNSVFGTIDSLKVSSNHNYLLFHSGISNVPLHDPTFGNLSSASQVIPIGFWWLYNIQQQTFELLPTNTISAQFAQNNVVGLQSNNSQESLTTYQTNGLQPLQSIEIPGSSAFYPVANGFILASTSNALSFTTNGVVSRQLLTNTSVVGVTSDGESAVGLTETGSTFTLTLFNLKTFSSKQIASNIDGNPAWSSQGIVLYETQSGNNAPILHTYDVITGSSAVWQFSGAAATTLGKSGPTLIALLNSNTAIIQRSQGIQYLVGSGLAGNVSVSL
jgi:hypothetical protein